MTEEEKKAIKVLEKYKFSEREEYLENNAKKIGKKYEDLYLERTWIPTTYERKQFTIVYNLIEKLQKENERKDCKILNLAEENTRLHKEINERVKLKIENEKIVDEEFIPKDKIRKKLKAREEDREDCDNSIIANNLLRDIYLLRELLEEE